MIWVRLHEDHGIEIRKHSTVVPSVCLFKDRFARKMESCHMEVLNTGLVVGIGRRE